MLVAGAGQGTQGGGRQDDGTEAAKLPVTLPAGILAGMQNPAGDQRGQTASSSASPTASSPSSMTASAAVRGARIRTVLP